MVDDRTPRSLHRGCITLAMLTVAGAALPAHADGLLTRNQSPLLAPYGFPSVLPARLPANGETDLAVTLNWANAAAVETEDRYEFTVDGEVRELRLRFGRSFGARFAVVAELPWREVSGGSLDGLVENWHDLLGLPNGSRVRLPRDELLIEYRQDDVLLLQLDQDTSGIADIPVAVGYQLVAADRHALAAWLSVKLPVGDADGFTGSGAADVALTLSGQAQLADRWQLFGQVDGVWLGQGDVLPQYQEDLAWSALAGLTWNAWRGLDLTAQLHANSKVFDVLAKDFGGDAVVLGFGGSYRTSGGWRFDVGVSEDLKVKASPDAAFTFSVRRTF